MKRFFASMVRIAVLPVLFVSWLAAPYAQSDGYEDAVARWTSHQDVASWLKENFKFDKNRQQLIQRRLKEYGPEGLLVQSAAKTFDNARGFCGDAAYFALDALNKINPQHNARWVFVQNGKGKPHHWVTGFRVDGKLYVMDYGAGSHWRKMKGVHGPYDSLDGYAGFLSSLNLKGFSVGAVRWREMPGRIDG